MAAPTVDNLAPMKAEYSVIQKVVRMAVRKVLPMAGKKGNAKAV